MAAWEDLRMRFDYDRWANQLWLENLQSKGLPNPDAPVFAHILSANEIWLQRCQGTSPTSMPNVPLDVREIERQHQGWVETLTSGEERVVPYKRTNGESLQLPLSAIAAHASNHGTYHRGELRGLCRARDDQDFPETDLARYFMANKV